MSSAAPDGSFVAERECRHQDEGADDYGILHQVDAGGMGEVYVAEDTRLQRRVAIKRIRPDLGSDATFRQRLLTEARSAARLDHPNICGIHEVGEDERGPFIVMPFIEGETLAVRLAHGPLSVDAVLDIGVFVAERDRFERRVSLKRRLGSISDIRWSNYTFQLRPAEGAGAAGSA